MKKTGKAGLGHHTKMEKISRQLAAGRAALAAKEEAGKKAGRFQKVCG
ncbi:MAG TPA: hypothetical protein VLX60_06165 [Terriglobales bacterium]|nr:hypothetical protein [Terriglobales bacterium]